MSRRDAVVAGALTLAAVVEVVLSTSRPVGLHLAVGFVACAVLALRRRYPISVLAVQSIGFGTLGAFVEQPMNFPVIAMIIAIYTIGEDVIGRRAVVALAMPLGGVFVEVLATDHLDDAIWTAAVIFFPPFIAGRLMQARRRQLSELEEATEALRAEQERAARLAAEAERVRLAREMHDVLSHGLSVVLLQAGAGERLLKRDPEGARQAFAAIAGAAGSALEELEEALTGIAPPADLNAVVERARAAGLDVDLHRTGDPAGVEPGVALAAHRIVQEALTNALRHSPGAPAIVSIRHLPGALEVEVENPRGGDGGPHARGGGRGLVGMRERAAAYGGTVEAGPVGGVFRVRAVLPTEGSR